MTLTAPTSTSPAIDAAVFGTSVDPFDAVQADDWVASVDSGRTGQLHVGLLAAVIAAAAGLGVVVHGASAGWWKITAIDRFGLDSIFALHQNLWAVSIAMPLWIAVASMVVPRQIGATRSAFPRLGNLALWGWLVGTALLITASLVTDGPQLVNLLDSTSAKATTGQAPRATDLVLAAIMLVTVATLAGAINLVATILTERAPGTKLTTLRPFSWAVLVTMAISIVTTPVFLAGTFLLYLDQHFGGQLFASGVGADRIWVHAIWLMGRPESILLAIPAVGAVADVIVHRTGKTLIGGGAANGLISAAAATSLFTWAGRELIAASATPPYARWWNGLILIPLFLLLLLLAGSARGGLKPDVSLLGALGIIVSVVAGVGLTIAVVASSDANIKSPEFTQFGLPNLLVFGLVLLGAVTMIVEHAGSVYGKSLPKPVSTLVLLALLGGVLVSGAGLAAGVFSDSNDAHAAGAIGKAMIAGGAGILLLGLLTFAKPTSVTARSTHEEGGH
jgi:heme/copper-type cytochrome/quinol oxidase subunit 1